MLYLNCVALTTFRLKETGVEAEYMQNAYVTKTFPNHYTLVTGKILVIAL